MWIGLQNADFSRVVSHNWTWLIIGFLGSLLEISSGS